MLWCFLTVILHSKNDLRDGGGRVKDNNETKIQEKTYMQETQFELISCITCMVENAPVPYRIIEWLRLEMTSKIKSNCQPNTTLPAKPRPEVPYSTGFLNTSRDGDSTTSLGSLFQCLTTLWTKILFLISSLNLPWHNLRPFPLVLSLVTWEKTQTPTSLQPPFR